MDYLRVKNWEQFQVYTDGRPLTFIKLYGSLLDDYEFCHLPDKTKAHLMAIWLLASRVGNRIPNDSRWVGVRIGATEPVDLPTLVESGFLTPYGERTDAVRGKSTAVPEKTREEKKRKEPNGSVEIQRIYDHWRQERGKKDKRYDRLSDNRRKKIQARLREFSADELTRAIGAVALDPWDDRPRHDDLTILFRNREQVDKFLAFADEAETKAAKKATLAPCPECGVGGGLHAAECGAA